MRENRPSGAEGGGTGTTRSFLPLSGCPLKASKRGERPGIIVLPARRRNPSGKGETSLGGL
jgi:hypothetical protein